MDKVEGRTAFITGGASGIGLGMAKAFTAAGMNCVLADVRNDHMEQAQAFFQDAGRAGQVHVLKLDVTHAPALRARFGRSLLEP